MTTAGFVNVLIVAGAIIGVWLVFHFAGWSQRKSNAGTLALAGAIIFGAVWWLFK